MVASSIVISGGTYKFAVGFALKEATDPVEMKQGAPLEFQRGSLVVVEESSNVAWMFLSSFSVSQELLFSISGGSSLAVMALSLAFVCLLPFQLWFARLLFSCRVRSLFLVMVRGLFSCNICGEFSLIAM